MEFVADQKYSPKLWNYILNIATKRFYYLRNMADVMADFKVAFRDINCNGWSKWEPFPSKMLHNGGITAAIDVHRSVLPNEIVIESDYPAYEENVNATRLIGEIIEEKGFKPHYYYSGNKSIHLHVFIDWEFIRDVNPSLIQKCKNKYKNDDLFREAFMKWLREKMITCWDLNVKKFDIALIKSSHLIRAELSKNKLGFKTFLGYTYKDLSSIPHICNEDNEILPDLGDLFLSKPSQPSDLITEFLVFLEVRRKKWKMSKKSNLKGYMKDKPEEIRPCVQLILNDAFKDAGDGMKRGMFILVNELTRILGVDTARIVIYDWNERMGGRINTRDIDYRLNIKTNYNLSCDFIHDFLASVGIKAPEKCR